MGAASWFDMKMKIETEVWTEVDVQYESRVGAASWFNTKMKMATDVWTEVDVEYESRLAAVRVLGERRSRKLKVRGYK